MSRRSRHCSDLAFMVSREQFEGKTLHLLKLPVRHSSYLATGVQFEERRCDRQPGRAVSLSSNYRRRFIYATTRRSAGG